MPHLPLLSLCRSVLPLVLSANVVTVDYGAGAP